MSISVVAAWVEIEAAQDLHPAHPVALLAEGVGRNWLPITLLAEMLESPSSRRAWVEISLRAAKRSFWWAVALLAEGVGRNSPRAS